ncbi:MULTISPECIES: hypothetical protein [unclassified Streptomyces]|uniref:hypothetical protein n=1 Tax=unclassified Streptomyces TaxID=2593676 RepID=UPI002DD9B3ED|nr:MULTISPECIES: hypothetical protein [unclassified Streptomyces]WSE00350.1 hypothetical protein OG758_42980 [Streptomyces sp. NBC_01474]
MPVAFEADAGGPTLDSGLLAAGRLNIVQGIVFRCWREDLAAGARLAFWMRPPV